MNTQNAEMDVESLQKRRRGCFLDAFLVGSVMFLFAAVTTLAVVGVMTVKDVESRLKPPSWTSESGPLKLTDVSSSAVFTNFAYLEATTSGLKNATMQWAVQQTSVGHNFQYDRTNHWMMPVQSGNYFMYVNLNFTCTHICPSGDFTIHVGEGVVDKLSCKVHLPKLQDSTAVIKKCWTVSSVASKQKLISHMTVPKEGLDNWSLDMGLGMFLVD
ncbi:uncharacterized protein LOC114852102 [Betta splendens]|uniref:Uncharacterized protein LOC114852102 n=1 Tax=Betta splendens TaxID=158456 RepID=A0A6P7M1F6_BETSP|nr:uncharacterized protein LOC114852102 [Betta splendens]